MAGPKWHIFREPGNGHLVETWETDAIYNKTKVTLVLALYLVVIHVLLTGDNISNEQSALAPSAKICGEVEDYLCKRKSGFE